MTCISCSVKLLFLISNVCKLKLIYKKCKVIFVVFTCNKGDFEGTQLGVSVKEDVHCTDSQILMGESFQVIPEFRILRLTFNRKSASKC